MELLRSIRFETGEVSYVEAGEDFRSGTRLYDSGVVGTLRLFLNGEELVANNRFPATFELSFTVTELHRLIATVTAERVARDQPFCCVCGAYGCTGISWEMEQMDTGISLRIGDSMGCALPAQTYRTDVAVLRDALSELAETLITTLHTTDGTTGETTHMLARIIE